MNGTKEVLKLSAAAQHLTRLIHVSTAFVVGTDAGHISPDSLNTSNDFISSPKSIKSPVCKTKSNLEPNCFCKSIIVLILLFNYLLTDLLLS